MFSFKDQCGKISTNSQVPIFEMRSILSNQGSYVSIKLAYIFILFGNLLLPYTALSEPARLIKLKETSYLHNLFS